MPWIVGGHRCRAGGGRAGQAPAALCVARRRSSRSAPSGLIDFWRWAYDYGHNLDSEHAIIKIPGMTYQPPLIGDEAAAELSRGIVCLPPAGFWPAWPSPLPWLPSVLAWRERQLALGAQLTPAHLQPARNPHDTRKGATGAAVACLLALAERWCRQRTGDDHSIAPGARADDYGRTQWPPPGTRESW